MKLKNFIIGLFLCLGVLVPIFTQNAYADRGRRHSHYRYQRYFPQTYFYYRRVYHPSRAYFYYDVYPQKATYYSAESHSRSVDPNYLPLTSIANMASQGIPEAVIISEIDRTRSSYILSSEIITYLKQNNVSDAVVDYMLKTRRKYG